MQLSKTKLIIATVLALVLILGTVAYADPEDGWKGYGLNIISGSKISIISEDVSIELQKDRLAYDGEFLIRNYSNSAVRAVLGIPVQGIDAVSITEKNSSIKWKKRSLTSLHNEFNVENLIPQEDYWYVFNLNLIPGETKLLNIELEAAQLQEESGSYSFTYFNDRKPEFSNQVEKSSLYIRFSAFEPYNIIALQGVDPDRIGVKGDILLRTQAEDADAVAIKYMDVTQAVMNRLLSSAMHKPREIALAFTGKNYSKASTLCDEYMNSLSDSQISQEEIQFVKAESLRRLRNYDKYLSIVEAMDYSKLYPSELKSKIYMDRMSIYIEQQNQEKLAGLYKELEQDTSESTQLLKTWIGSSGIFDTVQVNRDNIFQQIQQSEQKPEQYSSKFGYWYSAAINYRYTPIILFSSGLLLGLLLKKLSFKRKRKKSMYIYRM